MKATRANSSFTPSSKMRPSLASLPVILRDGEPGESALSRIVLSMGKKPKPKTLRELRADLRYWQGRYRIELFALDSTSKKIIEIASAMREARRK